MLLTLFLYTLFLTHFDFLERFRCILQGLVVQNNNNIEKGVVYLHLPHLAQPSKHSQWQEKAYPPSLCASFENDLISVLASNNAALT